MIDVEKPEIQFAIHAVREASKLASQIQSEMTASELTKGDRSPVTVADFAVQALVGHLMGGYFPNDLLVAEEDSSALQAEDAKPVLTQVLSFVRRTLPHATEEDVLKWIDLGNGKPKGRFWTLDPIDGTKGFMRGDQYAVALALVDNGEVQLGVLGCPNLNFKNDKEIGGNGSLFVALKGEGSWRSTISGGATESFVQIRVSDRQNPSEACVLRSVEGSHTNTSRTEKYLAHLGVKAEPKYMDSQAKHAVLASGGGDIFFYFLPLKNPDYRMKIWDVTAGSLVIEEAGGRVSDLEGGKIDFTVGETIANNPGLMYTNGHLHEAAISALKSLPA